MLQKIKVLILIAIPAAFIVAHANPYQCWDGYVYSLVDIPAIGRKLKRLGLPDGRQYYYYITNRSGSDIVFANISFECSEEEAYYIFQVLEIYPETVENKRQNQPLLRSKYRDAYVDIYFKGDLYGANRIGQHGEATIGLEYSFHQKRMLLLYRGTIKD